MGFLFFNRLVNQSRQKLGENFCISKFLFSCIGLCSDLTVKVFTICYRVCRSGADLWRCRSLVVTSLLDGDSVVHSDLSKSAHKMPCIFLYVDFSERT